MKVILLPFVTLIFSTFFSGCVTKEVTKGRIDLIYELRKAKFPIFFNRPVIAKVDDTGRIDIYQVVMNISNRGIKYLDITYSSYNGKEEKIADKTVKVKGPIKHAGYNRNLYEEVFHDNTVACIKINSLKVVFMDGKERYFSEKDIAKDYVIDKDKLKVCF